MVEDFIAWLKQNGDHVQGAEALFAIVVGLCAIAFFPIRLYLKRREKPAAVTIANPEALVAAAPLTKGIQMDVDSFVALQKEMRDEALKSVAEAHGEEKKRLEEKIDALNARLADPDRALAEQQAIIASLEEKLSRQGNQFGGDAIIEARAALEAGDFSKARNLFETVAAQTAPDVKTHADAAFALGQIAETEIRWHDAAAHFATAARLNPTFDTLHAAREFAWRAGDYAAAFRFGEDFLTRAKSQGTQEDLVTALNEHALTLDNQGHYAQAEALYRQALEIAAAIIGIAHPDYAILQSNLACVVQEQGRYAEAEELCRQALELSAATVGKAHPAYAVRLSNLVGAVMAQGRYAEAEELSRQALHIGEATIGTAHPAYAIRLSNLSGVMKAQGRYAEAEDLCRRALEIGEATIGTAHPVYAIRLNNLADVVEAQGRYAEAAGLFQHALAIRRDKLGDAHPHSRITAESLLTLLLTHFPDDPEIPSLQALLAATD